VPLGGFAALQGISGPQRMQIHRAYGGGARLMTAHTCFNQLDLPEAESMDELRERLLMAIHEGGEGFGFG
jgi:E3 ubiquitin-protein ligase HUWE1